MGMDETGNTKGVQQRILFRENFVNSCAYIWWRCLYPLILQSHEVREELSERKDEYIDHYKEKVQCRLRLLA